MSSRWVRLGEGVFARRYAELDLTVGLVVGERLALVIDTRGDEAQGAELAGAVREKTRLPLAAALTHAHFDHCFGTAAFGPLPLYAHRACPAWLRATAEAQRAEWTEYYRSTGDQATAAALAEAEVVFPDHPVDECTDLDLGGRTVHLVHPGAGHTNHDLAVYVPDAGVLFAGDLVEQGAPPDFSDADPLRWPNAVRALLELSPELVVPGHGSPVSPDFVAAQRAELASVAELCLAVRAGELVPAEAERHGPYPPETIRAALLAVTR